MNTLKKFNQLSNRISNLLKISCTMVYFAVYLKQMRFVVLQERWIENPELESSKIYYSPREESDPDFSLPVNYFFDENKTSTYEAFLGQSFGKFYFYFVLDFRFYIYCTFSYFRRTFTVVTKHEAMEHVRRIEKKKIHQARNFYNGPGTKLRNSTRYAPRMYETFDLTNASSDDNNDNYDANNSNESDDSDVSVY